MQSSRCSIPVDSLIFSFASRRLAPKKGDVGAYIWYDDLCLFLCCVFSFVPEDAFSSILGRFISVCPAKKVLDWRKGFFKELNRSTLKKRLYSKENLLGITEAALL